MLLPMGIAATLIALSALWTPLCSFVFLGEPVKLLDLCAIIISFFGVALMSYVQKPDANNTVNSLNEDQKSYKTGIAVGLFTSLTFAISTILTRRLKSVEINGLMLCHGFVQWCCCTVVILISQGKEIFGYEKKSTYTFIFMAAVANYFAQYFMTYAVQRSNPTLCILLTYSGIFYSFLIDFIIFKQRFTGQQLIGVAIVLSTNIAVVLYKFFKESTSLPTQPDEKQEKLSPSEVEIEELQEPNDKKQ